ncbi:MAG: carbohydrate ABC transporter permease [Spirochaetes bacterium]|nr:carbohydrate ABC transporter permease [Spirochaetota bacterium]
MIPAIQSSSTLPKRALLNIFLVLFTFVWFLPTLGLFISSFRHPSQIASSGWWTAFMHPASFTFENYKFVLFSSGIGKAFINSLIITVPSTCLVVIIASLAAYIFAFYEFPARKILFITFISLQVIPLQITLIPVLKMYRSAGIAGTFPGIWIAHCAYGLPFAIYLLRNFFSGIPYSMIESAQIDGASISQIFSKLIFPLSIPAIASLGIFQFIWVWNDLLLALVYLGGTPQVAPLTVKLASLSGSLESGWNIMTTAAFISMLLPLIIFFAMQKYFIEGILAGSVKG